MKLFVIGMAVLVVGVGAIVVLTNDDKKPVTASNSTQKSTPSLSIATIQNDVKSGGQLIDVRTAEEYTAGHIDGAINLSLQDIQAGTMPSTAKDMPVYVYCHSGNRSGQATKILKAAGFTKINDLGAMTHVQTLGGTIKS